MIDNMMEGYLKRDSSPLFAGFLRIFLPSTNLSTRTADGMLTISLVHIFLCKRKEYLTRSIKMEDKGQIFVSIYYTDKRKTSQIDRCGLIQSHFSLFLLSREKLCGKLTNKELE